MNEYNPYILVKRNGKTEKFYYFDFNEDDFDIESIATAVSRIHRFIGHGAFPYRLAQHLVLGSYMIEPEFAFDYLMHDAAEAFVCDFPGPIKTLVANETDIYSDLESSIEQALSRKFGFRYPFPPQVKVADLRMLVTEMVSIFIIDTDYIADFLQEIGVPKLQPYDAEILPWSEDYAKDRFLERFIELTSMGAEQVLKQAIEEIPGEDGWFHTSNAKVFNKCAKRMLKAGLRKEQVIEILRSLYSATAGEFGN